MAWWACAIRRHKPPRAGGWAARRDGLLEFSHLLPDSFPTPTTTTLAFLKAGYNVAFEPIAARGRAGASKIRLASDGAKFLLILLKTRHHFQPAAHLRAARCRSSLAAVYGAWNFICHARIPNGAVVLLLFSIMIMLVGLVAEQISTLRFEGRRS